MIFRTDIPAREFAEILYSIGLVIIPKGDILEVIDDQNPPWNKISARDEEPLTIDPEAA